MQTQRKGCRNIIYRVGPVGDIILGVLTVGWRINMPSKTDEGER